MNKILVGGSLLLVVVGLGCLNYTNFEMAAEHAEWAEEMGAPPPSFPIAIAGAAGVFVGAFVLGHRFATRRDR